MAQLSDLPNELIAQICSFVSPAPGELRLIHLAGRPKEDQAWAADCESRAALLSLGLSCRRFSAAAIPEIYRNVRIGLPGRGRRPGVAAKNDIIRLLKTLQLNPQAHRSVKQLWIYTGVAADGQALHIYYDPEDVKVLRAAAEAVGIWYPAEPGLYCSQQRLALDIFVLLSRFDSVEELGLSLGASTFKIFSKWLQWRKPPLRLKDLFLVAKPSSNRPALELHRECFSTFSLLPTSSIFLEGIRVPAQPAADVSNLTSIRLAFVDIDMMHLTRVIRDCRQLFTFWLIGARDLARHPAPPDPAIIMDALKQHAGTLDVLTLILGFDKSNRTIEDGETRRVTSLSSFRRLKVLRMDDKVFESGQRDANVGNQPHVVSAIHGFVGSLPPSLEHLELYWTRATHAVDDLRRLDLNVSSGLLPALRRVHIQQFDPPVSDIEESLRARGLHVVPAIKW